jgi:hypothetical protein
MLRTNGRLTDLCYVLYNNVSTSKGILCFCTVHCNIIIKYKPTKCTFPKLIFSILIFWYLLHVSNPRVHIQEDFLYIGLVWYVLPVPVAARSKAKVYGRSPAAIVVSIPTGGMNVCLLCVLSGRGLCDELITRPEESYRLPTVARRCVWSGNLVNEEAIARAGLQNQRQ